MRAGREACVYLAVLPPLRYTLFARKWTRKTERETRGATRHGLESGSAGVSGCRVRTKVLSSYACVRRALLARVDLAVTLTAWLRPGRTYGQAICLFSSAVDHTPSPPQENGNPRIPPNGDRNGLSVAADVVLVLVGLRRKVRTLGTRWDLARQRS